MAISQIIQFGGSRNDLVWEYTGGEDFNTASQLLVDAPYLALLVLDGQTADLFGPGIHTLSAANLPLLRKKIRLPREGLTPFRCKIFYLRLPRRLSVSWLTPSPVVVQQPPSGAACRLTLGGTVSLSAADPRVFLARFAYFRSVFTERNLENGCAELILPYLGDAVTAFMRNKQLDLAALQENRSALSAALKETLDAVLLDCGMRIDFFAVEEIAPASPSFCRYCGAALRPQLRFCTACGKAVDP